MATALILHKRINTTLAKAKALRVYVEPLITKSKEDSTHSRRVVFSYLRNKYAVSELFREVSQKVADRPGGYTRILKTGFRKGDAAEMCFIELVDYNAHMFKTEEDAQQKRTRRGRRGGKKAGDDATVKPSAEKAVTAPTGKEKPEAPVSDKAEAPETQAPEAPSIETPEAPETAGPEAPQTEAPEAPEKESPETPEKEESPESPEKEEDPETPKPAGEKAPGEEKDKGGDEEIEKK